MTKKAKRIVYAKTTGIVGIVVGTVMGSWYLYKKHIPKMKLKTYTKNCLYMATLDDEICRNELEGNRVEGKEIVFPPKRESLQYRYHMFLEMYKEYSEKKLEREIVKLEIRAKKSRQYIEKGKVDMQII